MPPEEGGGEHGCAVQDHPPATDSRGEDAPPHSTPLLPAVDPVASEEKEQQEEHQQPAASLPEGPLVEILSRVPYRSLCRFKCVSKAWLAFCSSRDIRRRSPQTLSGFFYNDRSGLHFRNLSGRDAGTQEPEVIILCAILQLRSGLCCRLYYFQLRSSATCCTSNQSLT
ncbi:hypothetical protein QYE76_017678 [Lolium multiflorum]|uniref:F-box domain-containing protein n=1 Tax=Lolium multiflorum TaxID=4521 RepID=A0AAD8VFT1_LOLMU|nr:hypothetical protein QYE76_017678 [Lolium multiflorum]